MASYTAWSTVLDGLLTTIRGTSGYRDAFTAGTDVPVEVWPNGRPATTITAAQPKFTMTVTVVEPDGYTWTTDDDAGCRGCDHAALFPSMPCTSKWRYPRTPPMCNAVKPIVEPP